MESPIRWLNFNESYVKEYCGDRYNSYFFDFRLHFIRYWCIAFIFVSFLYIKTRCIIEPLDIKLLIDTNTRGEMVTDNVCKSGIIIIENRVLELHSFRYA